MIRETIRASMACVVTFALCAIAYPLATWALGQLLFPRNAEGSLIQSGDQTVIGSELIGQPFASEKYFMSRPSAVDYKADATGGSNLGTKNPDQRKKVAERAEALKATAEKPAPVDLVMASGSGVDPDISADAAYYQVERVAKARKVSAKRIRALVQSHINHFGAILGAPERVNVLRLNLALDEEVNSSSVDTPTTSIDSKPLPIAEATPAQPTLPQREELAAIRSGVSELVTQVARLDARLDEVKVSEKERKEVNEGIHAIDLRLAKLSQSSSSAAKLVQQMDQLENRLKTSEQAVDSLREQIRQALGNIKALAKPALAPAGASLGRDRPSAKGARPR